MTGKAPYGEAPYLTGAVGRGHWDKGLAHRELKAHERESKGMAALPLLPKERLIEKSSSL